MPVDDIILSCDISPAQYGEYAGPDLVGPRENLSVLVPVFRSIITWVNGLGVLELHLIVDLTSPLTSYPLPLHTTHSTALLYTVCHP